MLSLADAMLLHGQARSIISHALTIFPGKKGLWRRYADLEKNHASRESLLKVGGMSIRCHQPTRGTRCSGTLR
jgi:hypothetical protein